MEWLQTNWLSVAAICFAALSEIIALSPLKSNSVVQLVMSILKKLIVRPLVIVLILLPFTFYLAPSAHSATVTLAWDASTGATGYKIYYGTAPRVYSTTINVGNVLTYTVSDLTGPAAPANVRLGISTATRPAGALIVWDSAAAATGYKIKYGTARGVYTTTIDAGNVTQYLLTGLRNNTTYYVVVTASGPGQTYYFAATAYDSTSLESDYSDEISYNASESAHSAELSFKTLAAPTLMAR